MANDTVQAFRAKDNSLHDTQIDREIHNTIQEVETLMKQVAKEIQGVAPYSDDFRCSGLFEDFHFEDAVKHLLANDLKRLAKLVKVASKLARLRKMKAEGN